MIELSNSRFGKVKYNVKEDIHSINILHGVCENFSMFLSETHRDLAENLSIRYTVEHIDNNMICMKFEKQLILRIMRVFRIEDRELTLQSYLKL